MSKSEQENAREKIKRFDDIFRMLLLVITIVLSVGVSNVNLVFVLAPLIFWMLGHAVGQAYEDTELEFKLIAWFYASFITIVILVKLASGLSVLSLELRSVSLILSLLPTFLALCWFGRELKYHQKKKLWYIISSLGPIVLYFSYI